MEVGFEQVGTIGIFKFRGKLTGDHEENLKLILMRAIHSIDRAVLNFKKVTWIDLKCLQLVKQAYLTSVRLKNPLILIEVPKPCSSNMINNKNGKDNVCANESEKITRNK